MKETRRDYFRRWGIPERLVKNGWKPRYTSNVAKGIYWYYFSLFVRERDVQAFGTCISCGRAITVDSCDAGHFIPASECGRDLLFDERNVNAECSACNGFRESHLLWYAEGLNTRYGPTTADSLKAAYRAYESGPTIKDWKQSEYEDKVRALIHRGQSQGFASFQSLP